MKRGEIWTLRDRQYASKARPVIVIQNDAYDNFDSVILCLFTTYDSSEIEVRVPVIPTPELGERIGVVSDADMALISEHLRKILAL